MHKYYYECYFSCFVLVLLFFVIPRIKYYILEIENKKTFSMIRRV